MRCELWAIGDTSHAASRMKSFAILMFSTKLSCMKPWH